MNFFFLKVSPFPGPTRSLFSLPILVLLVLLKIALLFPILTLQACT